LSLLADLLSKIKHKEQQVVIPPNLTQVVHRASGKRKVETRIKVVLLVALLLVVCGFGTIYLTNRYLESVSLNLSSPHVQEAEHIKTEQPPTAGKNALAKKTETIAQNAKIETVRETKKEAETVVNPPSVLKETPQQEDRQRRDNITNTPAAPIKKTLQSEKTGKLSDLEETAKNEKDVALYTAKTYEQNKNYGQAITHYKKALEKDPKNYLIMNNLANVLIKTGSFKESIQYSMDALTVQKNYIPSLINLGVANIQLGNMAEGEMYLLKAKSIEQSNKTVLFNLGLLYEKTSNYKESLAAFQRLADMKDAGGYLGMARILEKQGNRSEAEKIYKELLSLDSIDPATRQLANERLQVIGNR